ncbi:glycosyltransferase family 2 protein [Halobacteriovorax sp. YZS-1-1]|uniref:glycosyltransferase family 2 protein n=1 Tax=unclassified Halobacteriovorax TaxID=2639665 RepID=UPI0039999CE9
MDRWYYIKSQSSKKNNVRATIIIPYYNRLDLLEKAIDSVRKQTFNNFEVILINDGSTKCFNISEIKDIKIYQINIENSGPAAARNKGINQARGEYIFFLDSDDQFLPEKLEIQIKYMDKNPQIALCHTSYFYINKEEEILNTINPSICDDFCYPRIISHCPIAMPTVCVKTEVMKKFLFPETMRVGEDTINWIRIASKYRIGYIGIPLSKVLLHSSNSAHNVKAKLTVTINIIKEIYSNPSLNALFPLIIRIIRTIAFSIYKPNVIKPSKDTL